MLEKEIEEEIKLYYDAIEEHCENCSIFGKHLTNEKRKEVAEHIVNDEKFIDILENLIITHKNQVFINKILRGEFND